MPVCSRIFTFVVALGALSGVALAPGSAQGASATDADASTTLNLWRPGDPGQPIRISGWVRSSKGKPVPGATIFIRQADGTGVYTPEYQASLKTDKDGGYRFSTVLPGQYYGVKHIHIGVAHDGYEYLDTEIVFKGDPNLDPESDAKRAIHMEEATVNNKTVLFGRFDMTLRPLGGD
jgi:protocatechuate 3,4-dioxygenase beta subunit